MPHCFFFQQQHVKVSDKFIKCQTQFECLSSKAGATKHVQEKWSSLRNGYRFFFSKFFECKQLGFESCLGSMTIKQTYHSYQYIYPVRTAQLVAHQTGTGNVPGSNLAVSKLNFQLEKGCRRDSKQYSIKCGCIASNLN